MSSLDIRFVRHDTSGMSARYIYVVGKPDPQSSMVETIHRFGYKAGLLLDTQVTTKYATTFDRVLSVDFTAIDDEIIRLDPLDLNIAGLQCTYENYIIAKAKLGRHFDVPASTVTSAQQSTDKSLMRQAFMAYDPAITPNFTTIDTIDEALSFAADKGYPLIIKPTNLVKSLLVLRCNDEAELIANYTYAQQTIGGLYAKYNIYDRIPQLIIEEYIVGKICSIAAFVDSGGTPHFCDGIAALTNAQDRQISDNYLYSRHLPAVIDETLTEKLFDVAEKGIRALDMRATAAHVELIYTDSDVKLIEIGARIGGYRPRMYNYSYGLDLAQQEVRLALGLQPELVGEFKAYCAVYELFPEREGDFQSIDGVVDSSIYTSYSVKATSGKRVGPAKNGYKATAVIIVVQSDKQLFNSICQTIDQLTVRVAS